MEDIISKIGNSIIQYGKSNNRIYLMKLAKEDMPDIIHKLDILAKLEEVTKIFVKIPFDMKAAFIEGGYKEEGCIPGFYRGKLAASFLAKYFEDARRKEQDSYELDQVIKTAEGKYINDQTIVNQYKYILPKDFHCRKAEMDDLDDMVVLFSNIFKTYPFPIHNKDYLEKTMNENVVYYGIWKNNKLLAISSCEIDEDAENVEMTDFAVDPSAQGKNLSYYLLNFMEKEMRQRSLKLYYTIARASSYGMNITFAKMGYQFAGRLINNTNICGNIESMNLWYKRSKI